MAPAGAASCRKILALGGWLGAPAGDGVQSNPRCMHQPTGMEGMEGGGESRDHGLTCSQD